MQGCSCLWPLQIFKVMAKFEEPLRIPLAAAALRPWCHFEAVVERLPWLREMALVWMLLGSESALLISFGSAGPNQRLQITPSSRDASGPQVPGNGWAGLLNSSG